MNDITAIGRPKEYSSMADVHRESMMRITSLKVPYVFAPMDSPFMTAQCLKQRVGYLRERFDDLNLIAEHIAKEAQDYAGARPESVALLESAQQDFLAALTTAIDELEER